MTYVHVEQFIQLNLLNNPQIRSIKAQSFCSHMFRKCDKESHSYIEDFFSSKLIIHLRKAYQNILFTLWENINILWHYNIVLHQACASLIILLSIS